MVGIYKITNLINNKSYIGQSINIEKRWYEHKYKSQCEDDKSFNSILHIAFRKYGIDNFKFEILEELKTAEQLDKREQYYIKLYNTITPNGYNILEGGQKTRRTIKYCKQCGQPLKYSTTNYCKDCYHILQYRCEHPTKNILIEQVALKGFAQVARDYGVTDNSIKKWCKKEGLSIYKKDIVDLYNKINNITPREKQIIEPKKVAQIDKDTNEVIRTFNSVGEAARFINKGSSHITEVCNGIHKTAYGYKWKYI